MKAAHYRVALKDKRGQIVSYLKAKTEKEAVAIAKSRMHVQESIISFEIHKINNRWS